MKKIFFSVAIMTITSAINAQITEEKTMEDGSVVISYTPKIFTKEESEKINRRIRLIPTTEYLRKHPTLPFAYACMNMLEDEFNMIIKQDSSLNEAANNCFLSHIYSNENYENNTPVRYHQIWTLSESTVNYDHNSLATGLIEMMRDNGLQHLINKNATFFCQEFEFENKFYLVAIVND
ncbi:MAG: hypothetical protein FJZ80_00045 [Bacteroidetes bacterium]|nr:hypothetical protein [Bacteroidota bacterium]MBM3423957.1 hypothetical protein [Bacteroidota bacterium]